MSLFTHRPVVVLVAVLMLTASPRALSQDGIALSLTDIKDYYGVAPLIESGYTGKGVTIAVVSAFIDSSFRNDILGFDRRNDLPETNVTVVTPFDSRFTTVSEPSNTTRETTIDVELVHAMAPDAKVILVLSGPRGLLHAVNYTINENLADIVSMSFGVPFWGPEAEQLVESYNEIFSTSVARNITLIASSGDWGSNNTASSEDSGSPVWTKHTPFYLMPTYSPYFTIVGGTELATLPDGTHGEIGWNYSGGGPANIFPQPVWQVAPGVPKNGYRDIPDVSLVASCSDRYETFWQGAPEGDCGTSVAAPTFAGVVADIEQAAGHRLGFLNPSLYAFASSDPSAFHDVVSGNSVVGGPLAPDPGYCASPGWDFVTGLGSPDAVKLLRYFAPHTALNYTSSGESTTTQTTRSAQSTQVKTAGVCPGFVRPWNPFTALNLAIAAGVAVAVTAALLLYRRGAPKQVSMEVPPWD
ncbi:MAG: S53 family peptidase [Thaumarchaeota archaeon]|nr:S53 family peptidase [Nitrososphaerota archaeon]